MCLLWNRQTQQTCQLVPLTLGTRLPVAGYARNVPIQYIHKVAKVQQKKSLPWECFAP
jgi:hypothetical protein